MEEIELNIEAITSAETNADKLKNACSVIMMYLDNDGRQFVAKSSIEYLAASNRLLNPVPFQFGISKLVTDQAFVEVDKLFEDFSTKSKFRCYVSTAFLSRVISTAYRLVAEEDLKEFLASS